MGVVIHFRGCAAFLLPGQFAPRSESANETLANSLPGTFAPGPFRSLAHSLPGPLAPWNLRSQERNGSGTSVPYLLRPNGCMDQHATWYGGRPRPRRLCVRLQTAEIAPECTGTHVFSSKIEKRFWGGAQPPSPQPPPSAPTAPLATRPYGARPRRLRHLGVSPRPGSESSRE